MTQSLLWLRKEDKAGEHRVPLTPAGARELTDAGVHLVVESSDNRIFADAQYAEAGAELTALHWTQAPAHAVIIGLKELEDGTTPIAHRHIFFSHTFKGQSGAADVLARFAAGGGSILDLEFLADDQGRRIAAFGYWAGYAGAAVGLLGLLHYRSSPLRSPGDFPALRAFASRQALLDALRKSIGTQSYKVMVMGALGRCGRGAIDLLTELDVGIEITAWDKPEFDAASKPIADIIAHDLFVNCVYLREKISPMITPELLQANTRLSIISDVSCDPNNSNNPIAVYDAITSLQSPFRRAWGSEVHPVYLQAIDHLPTLLPQEASEEFAAALLPHLREFLLTEAQPPVWQRAAEHYRNACVSYGIATGLVPVQRIPAT
jgi:saccharopine dehydrogenase (NAD+, L-lysine-forming)